MNTRVWADIINKTIYKTKNGQLSDRLLLDKIIDKYKPARTELGNYIVTNGAFATSITKIESQDISSLFNLNTRGLQDINICADLMGPLKFTRVLRGLKDVSLSQLTASKLNTIVGKYTSK